LDNAALAQISNAHQFQDQASDKINALFHIANLDKSLGKIVDVNSAMLVLPQINNKEDALDQLWLQFLALNGLVPNLMVNVPLIVATMVKHW